MEPTLTCEGRLTPLDASVLIQTTGTFEMYSKTT